MLKFDAEIVPGTLLRGSYFPIPLAPIGPVVEEHYADVTFWTSVDVPAVRLSKIPRNESASNRADALGAEALDAIPPSKSEIHADGKRYQYVFNSPTCVDQTFQVAMPVTPGGFCLDVYALEKSWYGASHCHLERPDVLNPPTDDRVPPVYLGTIGHATSPSLTFLLKARQFFTFVFNKSRGNNASAIKTAVAAGITLSVQLSSSTPVPVAPPAPAPGPVPVPTLAPTGLTAATPSCYGALLSWVAPVSPASTVTSYEVMVGFKIYHPSPADSTQMFLNDPTAIAPDTAVAWSVRARSASQESPAVAGPSFTTKRLAMGCVATVSDAVKIAADNVNIEVAVALDFSWPAAAAAVGGYVLEYCKAGTNAWTGVTTATTAATVPFGQMLADVSYDVRVSGIGAGGSRLAGYVNGPTPWRMVVPIQILTTKQNFVLHGRSLTIPIACRNTDYGLLTRVPRFESDPQAAAKEVAALAAIGQPATVSTSEFADGGGKRYVYILRRTRSMSGATTVGNTFVLEMGPWWTHRSGGSDTGKLRIFKGQEAFFTSVAFDTFAAAPAVLEAAAIPNLLSKGTSIKVTLLDGEVLAIMYDATLPGNAAALVTYWGTAIGFTCEKWSMWQATTA
jgi:hypothetical protein